MVRNVTFVSIFFVSMALFFLISEKAAGQNIEDPIVYLEWVDDPLRSMVVNWIYETGNNTVEYRERGSSGNWNSVTVQRLKVAGLECTASNPLFPVRLICFDLSKKDVLT